LKTPNVTSVLEVRMVTVCVDCRLSWPVDGQALCSDAGHTHGPWEEVDERVASVAQHAQVLVEFLREVVVGPMVDFEIRLGSARDAASAAMSEVQRPASTPLR